jgi:hypothetical protein
MRKIINLFLIMVDWAITMFFPAALYFAAFYLVPVKTYTEQTPINIWIWFFIPILPILGLLMFNKKVRLLIFGKGMTIFSGCLLLFYFFLYYTSVAYDTYQVLFMPNIAKTHDYLDVPIFIILTILLILAGLFFMIRKLKKRIKGI